MISWKALNLAFLAIEACMLYVLVGIYRANGYSDLIVLAIVLVIANMNGSVKNIWEDWNE